MSKTDRSHRAAASKFADSLNSARSRQSSRDRLLDDILKLGRPKDSFKRSVLFKASRDPWKPSQSPEAWLASSRDKITNPFSKQLHDLTASLLCRKPDAARPPQPRLAEVWRQNNHHLQEKSKSRSREPADSSIEGVFCRKLDSNRLSLKEKADQITKILRAKNEANKKTSQQSRRTSQSPATDRSRHDSSRAKHANQTPSMHKSQLSRGSLDKSISRQEEYGIDKLRDTMRFRSSTGSSFKLLEKQLSKPIGSLVGKLHANQPTLKTAAVGSIAGSLVQSSLTGEFIRKHISNKSAIETSVVSKAREQLLQKKLGRPSDLKASSLERPLDLQHFRNQNICTRQRLRSDDKEPRDARHTAAVLKKNKASKRNQSIEQDSRAAGQHLNRLATRKAKERHKPQESIDYFKEPSVIIDAAAIQKAVSHCFEESVRDCKPQQAINPADFEMHEFVETVQREIQAIGHRLDSLIGGGELESSLRLRHSSEYVSTQRESIPEASSLGGEQSITPAKAMQYTNVKGEPVVIPSLNFKLKALPCTSQTPTNSKLSSGSLSDRTQDISYHKRLQQEVRNTSSSFLNQVDEESAILSERKDAHRINKQSSISDIEIPNQEEIVIRELGFKKKQGSQLISEATHPKVEDADSDTIFETFGADLIDSRESPDEKSSHLFPFPSNYFIHPPSGQHNLQIPSLAEKWKSKQHKQTTHRNLITPQATAAASSKSSSHKADDDKNR